jgi:hypothetical protein
LKKTLTLLFMMAFGLVAVAQTYVGTMTVDGYKREEVKVTLRKTEKEGIVLTMYRVKFARMMPVKIDFDIPQMKLEEGRLTADGVVPVSKGKRYEKYTIHRLEGKADSKGLAFSCMMGDKPFSFTGKRKEEKKK